MSFKTTVKAGGIMDVVEQVCACLHMARPGMLRPCCRWESLCWESLRCPASPACCPPFPPPPHPAHVLTTTVPLERGGGGACAARQAQGQPHGLGGAYRARAMHLVSAGWGCGSTGVVLRLQARRICWPASCLCPLFCRKGLQLYPATSSPALLQRALGRAVRRGRQRHIRALTRRHHAHPAH